MPSIANVPCWASSIGSPNPRHPQTSGMVERFNGRISDVVATTRFRSREDLQTTIERYVKLYNDQLPQKALGHKTPLQAMRAWPICSSDERITRRDQRVKGHSPIPRLSLPRWRHL